MEPELTLVITFILALFIIRIRRGTYQYALAGRIAMSCMLLVTSIAHFFFVDGMALMMPDFIPFKNVCVYITGILEFAAAIFLLIPKYSRATGWLLILFFLILTPFNIYAAMKHVDMEKVDFTGDGPAYLWYRIPLQLFFMLWVYLAAGRSKKTV
jgi:uncharacterized membrane protein